MLDFILHIDQHLIALAAQYGIWIYAILFIIVFCETGLVVTPFLPGDSLLFAAGAVATASAGALNVHLIVAVLLAAAVLGDASNFEIGKYFGAKLFARPNSKIFKPEYLAKTHAFYEKYGGKTIILARFVPIVRTFVSLAAGISSYPHRKFNLWNILGAVLWIGLIGTAGVLLGGIEFVHKNIELLAVIIVLVSVVPVAIEYIRGRKKEQKALSE